MFPRVDLRSVLLSGSPIIFEEMSGDFEGEFTDLCTLLYERF